MSPGDAGVYEVELEPAGESAFAKDLGPSLYAARRRW